MLGSSLHIKDDFLFVKTFGIGMRAPALICHELMELANMTSTEVC
jgi:hypothetical protein